MIGAEAFGIVLFAIGLTEHRSIRSERVRKLRSHVAETAKSNHSNSCGTCVPVFQRRIECDAGAEQRRGRVEQKILRHAQEVLFIHHNFE